ncbi:hypothetical protein LIER_43807 [Lithospermum erythrorhizon]|uniref:Transposase (putative) gypsy type domain-containing protein n=1 Tax=Lithospermum erythrorhizon TaxID=34254 RepID=A0AAV3QX58_LITER
MLPCAPLHRGGAIHGRSGSCSTHPKYVDFHCRVLFRLPSSRCDAHVGVLSYLFPPSGRCDAHGLRFPVHPFIGEVLSMPGVGPAQLTPNMWIFIVGFYSVCLWLSLFLGPDRYERLL